MNIFLNGAAASAGGGVTYLRNVIPQLKQRLDMQVTVALQPILRSEFQESANISLLDVRFSSNAAFRFWQEQRQLPGLLRQHNADVLISAGNIALHNSPVPQVLLSRNALYTSTDFYRDLYKRRDYRLILDTWVKGLLAQQSIHWADCTVAPSRSFANDLAAWTSEEITTIPHGFDAGEFQRDNTPLSLHLLNILENKNRALRLLFVSHYNYYRNFETLLRAIPILRERLSPRKVEVVFTCRFSSDHNPGNYHAENAARLVRELGIVENVIELGPIPYSHLHRVYRACDVYVSPAYAESFAHPLVEAMSCGLPIVASDIAVHREICGDAALYFARFSPHELADAVVRASEDTEHKYLSMTGIEKSKVYSWKSHVDQLIELAQHLVTKDKSLR